MSIEEYLDRLTEQLRCRKAREPVREEIRQHLEDQTAAFMADGMGEQEAKEAAVREMGDPIEVGNELDRIHRPKMAWRLMGLIVSLGIGGYLVQYFLQARFLGDAAASAGNPGKQMAFLLLGFGIMTGVCFLDYSWFGKRAGLLSAVLYGLLLAGKLCFGTMLNGSQRWISVGSFSIDISMFLFLLVPLYGAVLYSWRGQGYGAVAKGCLWMLPAIWLALKCPSMYAGLVLMFSSLTVLTAAVGKGWFQVSKRKTLGALWGTAALAPVVIGVLAVRRGGYQAARLAAILDPGSNPDYLGNIIRGLLADSKWVGAADALSTEAAGAFAQDLVGEYILTFVISYYGILAGIVAVGLIVWLLIRLYRVSVKQRNQLGQIMGIGCASVLTFQVALYLMGNAGTLLMGAYCPFLTNGGSGMAVDFCLFGLVLSVYRYENVLTERRSPAGRTSRVW